MGQRDMIGGEELRPAKLAGKLNSRSKSKRFLTNRKASSKQQRLHPEILTNARREHRNRAAIYAFNGERHRLGWGARARNIQQRQVVIGRGDG